MKSRTLPLLALAFGAVSAFGQSTVSAPPVEIVARISTSTATLTLGDPPPLAATPGANIIPFPPRPPFTFSRGTHLRLVIAADGITNPVVRWYKDGNPLPETSPVLDLPSVSTSDAGTYSATLNDGTTFVRSSDTAQVLITDTGAPLSNYSTRAVLSSSQPFVLGGFVVQAGPAPAMVLIRAVGPALAQFGVSDPLAAPRLEVWDSRGREVSAWDNGSIVVTDPSGAPLTTSRVGEFPLPAGGKDVQHIYRLSPGAYTARVSSADGGTGTVLLEVYQLPL